MARALLYCLFYAILNVSGAALIKWKLKGRALTSLSEWLNFLLQFQVVAAFVIIFGSALVMFKALSSGNFSFIIPVSVGINFMFTVLLGYYLFKDPLNYVSFIGFALILTGIVLLSFNSLYHAK